MDSIGEMFPEIGIGDYAERLSLPTARSQMGANVNGTGYLSYQFELPIRGSLELKLMTLLPSRFHMTRWHSILFLTQLVVCAGVLAQSMNAKCACVSYPQDSNAPEIESGIGSDDGSIDEDFPDLGRVDGFGDPLPQGARMRIGTKRLVQPSYVAELSLSPDQERLVTVGRTIVVWDANTGEELWRAPSRTVGLRFSGAAYGTQALSFSKDGKRFYTPGGLNKLVEWDIETGEYQLQDMETPAAFRGVQESCYRSIDVSPDGERVALGRGDGVFVANLDGEVLYQFDNVSRGPIVERDRDRLAFQGHFSFGQFSPDGRVIAVVNSDNPLLIRICDVEEGEEINQIELEDWAVEMHFSPDNRSLAVAERDGSVRVYGVHMGGRTWERVFELTDPFENYTSAVAFSPDGETVAVAATNYLIYLLDAANGDLKATLEGHDWYPLSLDFSDDSQTLISGGYDDIIRRWDVESGMELPLENGVHSSEATDTSSDGRWIAYNDDHGTIHLISAQTGEEQRTFDPEGIQSERIKFSTDSQLLAVGGAVGNEVGAALFWVDDGELLHRWTWPKGRDPHASVDQLDISPDGKQVAAGVFRQNKVFVWDTASGETIAELEHSNVYGISFHPDGTRLLTGGWDSIIRVWDAKTWEMEQELAIATVLEELEDPRVYGLRVAPRGGLMATTHIGGGIVVWDVDSLTPIKDFGFAADRAYRGIAFSPDGLWLVIGGNQFATMFEPISGDVVWDLGKHDQHVSNVSFGADQRLFVSSSDRIGYQWDLRLSKTDDTMTVEGAWDQLMDGTGREAFQATEWFLMHSDELIDRINEEELVPSVRPTDGQYDAWIRSLTGDELIQREKAERMLFEFSYGSRPRLEQAIATGNDSEELAMLLKAIISHQLKPGPRRLVSLLRQIDTDSSRALLRQWEKDAPHSVYGHQAAH